jgi:hypothetical protein
MPSKTPANTPSQTPAKPGALITPEMYRELRPQFVLASLGALLVGIAYLWLPGDLIVGPSWLLLALAVAVLLPLFYVIFFHPQPLQVHHIGRWLRLGLQTLLTLALLSSIVLYVTHISFFQRGVSLLRPAALLWVSNILIFAVWYWEIDGDGPVRRHLRGHPVADFLFPQQTAKITWVPGYVDYLFLAFNFATALSPADTAPLTPRAKLLMMGEAVISLSILVLLVARSVNIL